MLHREQRGSDPRRDADLAVDVLDVHTTREMAARIATAIEQRLSLVLEAAEQALEAQPSRSAQRVF